MGDRSTMQVEESRAILRALLSRRDFVQAGLVGALGLAGCSSGDPTTGVQPPPPPPGTIPDGLQAVTGTVSLPAGSTLKLADLSVDIMAQTVPVSASAGFTVGVSPGAPSLALLLDANNLAVMMAVFDPTTASFSVSPRTSAVALLYFGVGGPMFPSAVMSQILALLNADPAVAAVETAIAHAVATDPHAIANNAAPLGPAITQALNTIVGASLHGPSGSAISAKPAPANLSAGVPTLMTVNPSVLQNGVLVSQDIATTSLLISNTYRRPCKVYVYEVQVQPPGVGVKPVEIKPAQQIVGPIDLDSTESLGLFNSLRDFATFFHGKAPWSPVNLPAIPLALDGTNDGTTYKVITLAASWKALNIDAPNPPFFNDDHFTGEITKWTADYRKLFLAWFFGDIVLPIILFCEGAGVIKASNAIVAQIFIDAQAIGDATLKRIIDQLHYGSITGLSDDLIAAVQAAFKDPEYSQFWDPKVKAVVGQAEARALVAQTAAQRLTVRAQAAQIFTAIFAPIYAVGLALAAVDLAGVLIDGYNSDLGASWDALLIKQKLNLHPNPPDRVTPGDVVPFSVSPPANVTGTFQYEWSQTSPFAFLSAHDEVNVGASIKTSDLNVDLKTLGSDTNPINVLVIGYDISQNPRVEIGRAGTTVNFLQRAEILPANAAVDIGEQRLFSVNVEGQLPSGVRYKWTLNGTAGSIGDTNVVITTLPQINYTGITGGGNDVLHVDVIDLGNNVVARADAAITIARASSIQFVVAGTWANNTAPANGSYAFADFEGGRVPLAAPGVDAITFTYDNTVNSNGVIIPIVIAAGSALHNGQTFTKFVTGPPIIGAGQFQLTLMVNLSDPDHSLQRAPGNSGTLTITSVAQLSSGAFLTQYSFSVSNGAGGTIIGSGVGRWK